MEAFDSSAKQNFFTTLNIIFIALSIGQLIFFGVVFFIASQNSIQRSLDLDSILLYLSPIYSISMIFLSKFLYNKYSQNVDKSLDIKSKAMKYRTASIVNWAMLESANLFSLVSFLITGNYVHLLIFTGVFAGFILNRPSKEKFITDYNVTTDEINNL
jgi:uncharacterized membrane protein